jgi:hypothetical protein
MCIAPSPVNIQILLTYCMSNNPETFFVWCMHLVRGLTMLQSMQTTSYHAPFAAVAEPAAAAAGHLVNEPRSSSYWLLRRSLDVINVIEVKDGELARPHCCCSSCKSEALRLALFAPLQEQMFSTIK